MPESVEDRCTKSHEYIFLLSKKPKYYYDHEAIKETTVSGGEKKNKRSVWTVNAKGYKGAHFAVYPENLIQPCVLAGCPKWGVVFDPFTGSGTTAVVAMKNNRHYIGTELNPEYVKIAEERIKEAVPQTLEEILNG
jgi:DNA modification methylase